MVDATPIGNLFTSLNKTSVASSVKETTKDILISNAEAQLDETERMVALSFEQVGSQEIINIARHDTISGQALSYQPITNLAKLAIKYGPQSIIPIQNSSRTYFDSFAIKLEKYLPNEGQGLGGSYVYISSSNDLVIDLVNITNEQVEVQILKTGDINNGTIY